MDQFPPVETFLYRTMLPSAVPFEDFWGRKRKYFYGRSRKNFPKNREAYFGESHGNSFIVRNGPAFGTASKLAEEANSKSNPDYLKSAKMQDTEHFEGEKQWDEFLYNCIGTISFLSPKNPNPDQSKVVRPKVESPEVRRQKLKWRQKKQNEKKLQEEKDLSWETVEEQPVASFKRGSFPKIRLRTNDQEESKSFDEDKEFDDQYLATHFNARELQEDFDDFSLMKVTSDIDKNSHKGIRNFMKFKNKESHKGKKKNSNGYYKKQKTSVENVNDNEKPSSKFQNAKKKSFSENIILPCDDNKKPWTNPPLSKNANVFHKKHNKIFDEVEDNEQSSSKFHTKKKSVLLPENVLLQCDDKEMAWSNTLLSKNSNVYNKTQNKIFNKVKDNKQSSGKYQNVKNKFDPLPKNIVLPCDDNENAWTNPPFSKNSTMYHEKQNKISYNVKDNEQLSSKFQTGQKISETWPELQQCGDNEKAWTNPPLNRRGALSAKIRCATLIKEPSNNSKEDCASRRAARSGRSWGAFSCNGDIDYQLPNSVTRTTNWPEENLGLSTLHAEKKLPYIVESAENWDNNEETFNLTGTTTITSTPNKETVTTGSSTIHTSVDNLENESKYEKDDETSPTKSISETEPKENFKLSNIIGKISRRYIRGRRIWNGWCYTEDESSYRPFIQKLLSKSARRNEKQNGAKSSDNEENLNKPKLEDATVDDDPKTGIAKINLVKEEDENPSTIIAKLNLVREEDSTVNEDLSLVIAKMNLVDESGTTVDEDPSTVIAKINLAEDPQRRTVEEKAITSSVSCTILKQGNNTSPKKTVRFDTNANKIHEDTYNKEPPMRKPVYSRGQIRGRRVLDCKPLI